MTIRGYFHAFLDIFYSRSCLHCSSNLNSSHELYLCEDCTKGIPYVGNEHCIRCGTTLGPHTVSTTEGCMTCKGRNLPFSTVTSVTYYEGAMKTLIHKFKYSGQKFLCNPMNTMVLEQEKVKELVLNIDVIVPVPLYWIKKNAPGFQSGRTFGAGNSAIFFKTSISK